MGLSDLIEKAINEHGSAAILRERLILIREQADALQKMNTNLESELANCKKRITNLESELSAKITLEEFVEHRGALFKRNPSGGYQRAVYCPLCRLPMGNAHPRVPFNCSRCHIMASFNGDAMDSIIKELPSI